MSAAGADTLEGHRSISDVTFDLDGELSTEIGWVVFEVSDEQPELCCGVIGTFNNYVTLRLIRFARFGDHAEYRDSSTTENKRGHACLTT